MPYESDEREQADRGRPSISRTRVADAILNAAADAIVACDRDGIICFWNPGASRVFGFA
ncbi:MAG: PAS domain-containing protein, partial [Bryobacteraceae bacterium]